MYCDLFFKSPPKGFPGLSRSLESHWKVAAICTGLATTTILVFDRGRGNQDEGSLILLSAATNSPLSGMSSAAAAVQLPPSAQDPRNEDHGVQLPEQAWLPPPSAHDPRNEDHGVQLPGQAWLPPPSAHDPRNEGHGVQPPEQAGLVLTEASEASGGATRATDTGTAVRWGPCLLRSPHL